MATDKPRIQAFLEPEVYQALTDWQQKRGIPKNSEAVNQILKEYFGLSAESPEFASSPNSEELRLLIQEELWGAGKSDFIDGLRVEAQAIIAKEVTEAKEYWRALDLKETIARQQAQIEALVYHVKQLEEICKPIEGLAELSKPLEKDDISDIADEELRQDDDSEMEAPPFEKGETFLFWGDEVRVERIGKETLYCHYLTKPNVSYIRIPFAIAKDIKAVSELPSDSLSELNLSQLARHFGISKSVISRRKSRSDFEEWSKTIDPEGKTWTYDPERQIFTGAAS